MFVWFYVGYCGACCIGLDFVCVVRLFAYGLIAVLFAYLLLWFCLVVAWFTVVFVLFICLVVCMFICWRLRFTGLDGNCFVIVLVISY